MKADTGIGRSFDVYSRVLGNGLKLLLVENPTIPAVSINGTLLAGARQEPENKAGLAIMTSNLLDEGTKTRSSFEIADAIENAIANELHRLDLRVNGAILLAIESASKMISSRVERKVKSGN